MNTKPPRKGLLVAGIALLLASCGKAPETTKPETPPAQGHKPSATPDVLPNTLTVKRLAKTYVITGIGLGGTNKVAIINNQVIKPGAEIDPGVVLKDVQPTYAIILYGNTEHLLRPEDIQRELDKKKP
ncbi:MAG: general secretion pathway protein GspB [Kiritimatiellales bacterium]|nr:general secretion pathway protein GspB [Kiritimatiellales bacterium]MCF7863965.1 general secretion pathway protein GspB [Kiritimatiellales bacterium]